MKIKVALDWTPNAIHAGLYIAMYNGWYKEAGLDVELISPEHDQYEVPPIEKLFRKNVTFAIAPSEMVIRSHQYGYKELIALAAILQGSPSAFATIKSSGIDSVEKLKGKTYASLELPFERAIVQALAGKDVSVVSPMKLDIYKLLFEKKADFVWLFRNIELVEALQKGIDLNLFSPEEAGIPYGPCTLLISHQEFIADYSFLIQAFFEVINRAYKSVVENPVQAAEIMHTRGAENFPDKDLLTKTIKASCDYFLTNKKEWGILSSDHWENYLTWLEENGQIKKANFNHNLLYSNRFLK